MKKFFTIQSSSNGKRRPVYVIGGGMGKISKKMIYRVLPIVFTGYVDSSDGIAPLLEFGAEQKILSEQTNGSFSSKEEAWKAV